jgi:hypothetical protein
MWKNKRETNPPAPFPEREWGEFKASLLAGERFSRSREKSGIGFLFDF